jgi:hypothetical protein
MDKPQAADRVRVLVNLYRDQWVWLHAQRATGKATSASDAARQAIDAAIDREANEERKTQ